MASPPPEPTDDAALQRVSSTSRSADRAVPEDVARARDNTVAPGPDDEALNDDERRQFSWKSRYEASAWKQIKVESTYVVSVILVSLSALFAIWHGGVLAYLVDGCVGCSLSTLRRYGYVFFAGVLGGGLFGLKYLYKVVARGWWNEDRVVWRYASPLLSGGLAFATGALAEAGIFGFSNTGGGGTASFVALGFIVGYFADKASGKMQEIAETMFGAHPQPRQRENSQGKIP